MSRINLAKLAALLFVGTTMMYGQATRTWVSGVGDDANPCSRTAPCKTFAGAISKTAAGGEIDALDPGGFGAVTITKAITIDGGGQVASVLVSGTNGIIVQAGASDVVTLRNLRINGLSSGLNGIRFLSGRDLNVENCYIFGFTANGIDIALSQATVGSVHILNTVMKNNGQVGIRATNAVLPAVQVGIDHTSVMLDYIGIQAAQHSRVVVSNSLVQHATAHGVETEDLATNDAEVNVSNSEISFNGNGVTASRGGAANVSFSDVGYNVNCSLTNAGGRSFLTYGSNRLIGIGPCGNISAASQQ